MPRPPHSLALFSLLPKPGNERAERVVSHQDNERHVSVLPTGERVLDVGFQLRGKSSTTLATLGRGVEADIYLEGSSISRIQCSFEIDLDTGIVMLYDRSHGCTTQVSGESATPFEYGRVRKVVVRSDLNTVIQMGGERRDLFQFKLKWHQSPAEISEFIEKYDALLSGVLESPRVARTEYNVPTDLPSRMDTRIHTPGPRQLKMRYAKVNALGCGQFGAVHKVIDVDSGKLMAVKIFKLPAKASNLEKSNQTLYHALKREVEALSIISHPHIVDYITSQGWEDSKVEIFMGLKEGTVESLVESGADTIGVANIAFPQMLTALDCIAWKGIVHRDVKPENILYTSQPCGPYQFQLGDFGLCNRAIDATTFAGSRLYMAPEMFKESDQTHKVDVWSLFVTLLWILDAENFRQRSTQFRHVAEVQRAILSATANLDMVSRLREMAITDPNTRASAAQMLVKLFDGEGLSTPRSQVPALPNSSSSAANGARKVPVLTPSPSGSSRSRIPRPNRRTPKVKTNIFAAAARYHIEKVRGPLRADPIDRNAAAR